MPRRALVCVVLVVLGLTLFSSRASAHALLERSEPAAGATLASSPREVVLHFTEQPDVDLSAVHVVDSAGKSVEQGGITSVAGDAAALRVGVPTLPNGTYTVAWRVTSSVDGHTTAGSFAFGVGEAPVGGSAAATSAEGSAPSPTVLGTTGRGLLYAGLAVLVGGGAVALVLRPATNERWIDILISLAWLGALIGATGLGLDEFNGSGASFRRFLSASTGRDWKWLLGTIAVTGLAIAVFAIRRWRTGLVAVGGVAALAMLVRVDTGHAAASSTAWFTVGTQWLHFVAVGAWVGALPWFAALLWRTPTEDRRAVARRFSRLAAVGLAVVIATGTLRAVDEVDTWDQLLHTAFGRTLLLKLGLVAGIASIGTINHFVLTRRLPAGSTRLQRATRIEIGVGTAIVMVTGLLTGLAPASSIASASSSAPANSALVVEGHDYATTIRVRLELDPGVLGTNRFIATITDYDTGTPDDASAVKLRFSLASRTDIGSSTLDLTSSSPGRWEGSSATLAIVGVWSVTAVVSDARGGVEVPLRVTPGIAGQVINRIANPGVPTIYDIRETDGTRVQAYADPGTAGSNQVHVTLFDAAGAELPAEGVGIVAFGPSGNTTTLAPARLGAGHFVAPATLSEGTWTFAVTVTLSDHTATALFDHLVESQ